MRIVVDRGKQPGSALDYLLRKDKREKGREAENPILHTNMFGTTPQELTEELRFSADLNPRVERTYVQYKVSFPPGENPDLKTKTAIVEDLLQLRHHGLHCQFVAVEHFEKIEKHDVHHLHVLASTVRLDGSWVDDAFERVKLKDVERAIEAKHALQDCSPLPKGQRTNTSIREVKLKQQGLTLVKDTLRQAIDLALQDQPSMPLLMARLKAQGYAMHFHEFDNGKGVSFGANGFCFKGRQLGDRFSFQGLQDYAGVDYLPLRDDPMLRHLNDLSAQEAQQVCDLSLSVSHQNQQIWSEALQLVDVIWLQARTEQPHCKSTSFEDYSIQLDAQGLPELYRAGALVLKRSSQTPQSSAISQLDVDYLLSWQSSLNLQLEKNRQDREEKARKLQLEKKRLDDQQAREIQQQPELSVKPKQLMAKKSARKPRDWQR